MENGADKTYLSGPARTRRQRNATPHLIVAVADEEGHAPDESPYKGKTGLHRIWNALHYSLTGLREAFRHEDAFRQETLLAVLMIPLAFWLRADAVGRALLIASVLLVLIVELLNSAIEATVNRVSLDRHHLAKRAKDIGSAAVLLALINMAVVWTSLLLG